MTHDRCGPRRSLLPFLAEARHFGSAVRMHSWPGFLNQPRENEIRVIEHDGRRWLQQWRMPPDGHYHERAWVDVAEIPWPSPNVRLLKPTN